MRGFLFSVLFMGLALLAFNPYLVLAIQDKLSLAPTLIPHAQPDIEQRDPPVLPDTDKPDADNLPRIPNFERLAKNDSWVGISPCSTNIFDAPLSLPTLGPRQNGPVLTEAIQAGDRRDIVNEPTFLYTSESGITLKLVQPVIEYYDVSGRRYRDAKNDMFDRQPLLALRQPNTDLAPETRNQNARNRVTTVADILSPSSLSYTLSGSRDRYRLVVNKTIMTSAFLVTLPRWKNYASASTADKAKWDDFFCNSAHHELGHLRIRLDITAETLDGYAALPPAQSYVEMEELTVEYRKEVSARVQTRQDAYHIYNGGGLRRGMTELPYAELPFPWLDNSRMVEQLPAQQ